MSAIVGLYYLDGRNADPTDLQCMIERVAHRGPDGSGIWHSGPVGLGHLMLQTTPESLHEHLPLCAPTGDIALTADARIDNREDLIGILRLGSRRSEEISDSELILAAYERWGERSPEKLIGDYAFAIWDNRRKTLFCARDHMGIRPFYYYLSQHFFAFASEIKALLALSEVPRRLDELVLADRLLLLAEERVATLYRDIVRLQAAHTLIVRGDGSELRRYWSLNPSYELRLPSDEDYQAAFLETFSEAVRCRLRSTYPVGSTLSGGLDSSSVACVAQRICRSTNRPNIHTFSAVFPNVRQLDPRIDESHFIDAVLASGDFIPFQVVADLQGPMMSALWQNDEPILDANAYWLMSILDAAQAKGIRVILDGLDGDSVVEHGYEYLAELMWTGKWRALFGETQALSERYGRSRTKTLWKWAIKPLIPGSVLETWGRVSHTHALLWDSRSLISDEFAQRMGMPERIATAYSSLEPARNLRSWHRHSLNSGSLVESIEQNYLLAGQWQVELRHPFFDRRLMELCLAMPGAQKLYRGWDRAILRRAMEGVLPEEVQWRRSKGNLSINFTKKLFEDNHELLEDLVATGGWTQQQYIDGGKLQAAYARYVGDPIFNHTDSFALFWVLVHALWLRNSGLRLYDPLPG